MKGIYRLVRRRLGRVLATASKFGAFEPHQDLIGVGKPNALLTQKRLALTFLSSAALLCTSLASAQDAKLGDLDSVVTKYAPAAVAATPVTPPVGPAVQYDDATQNKATLGSTVSTDGGATGGTTVTNVHQAALSATSTDAVNGAQLYAASEYVQTNSTGPAAAATGANAVAVGPSASAAGAGSVAVGSGASAPASNAVALGAGSVADRSNSVSVGAVGAERQITNVAAGTSDTDAANVGQVNTLGNRIQKVSSRANAGIASALATAGLPQAYLPGKSMAAVAGGSFHSESSIAVGVSTISEGGRWVYKVAGSLDTRGDGGVSVGAGMQF